MRFHSFIMAMLVVPYGAATAAAPEVIGPVYPVREPDMVVWLKERAAARFTPERLAQLKAEREKLTREYLEGPPGVQLPRTMEPATRWFDPSITVPYDLRDSDGNVIHRAGTTINPLDWTDLTRRLLFFDARDEEQMLWAEGLAREAEWRVKLILVAGAPLDVARKWGHRISFDQKGILVTKFGIRQVPAVVRQQGKRLRIDEVLP